MKPLQVWGGVECTVNRVGNFRYNQLERTGHTQRLSDLDRIAELGIRTVRYPILWELNAPDLDVRSDWTWATERLNRLRELEIVPIVGLVHHGSGPICTCLTDERFASGLAAYAGGVAARFPWIEWYTPINEPLTTARFSGLYGLWYPHGRDNHTFCRALVNQCRATILSMRAIRRLNPSAKLLQTDDVGTTYSTSAMRYQADFDNERRWLGWDLISGRVGADHPLRRFLLSSGISDRELDWICEFACPPDLLGVNHYVTSDRFLDERLDRYPCEYWGANARESYADVDAVRVLEPPQASWSNSLRDVWRRYHLPIALTEVHLGCTREEQLRWFAEAWAAVQEARRQEIEVVGITAWALFGSFDWDSLLTRNAGHYESGVFDIRGPEPRATAIAQLVRKLIADQSPQHPVLDSPGWWHREERLLFEAHTPEGLISLVPDRPLRSDARPLLVWSSQTAARSFARVCEERGLAHRICSKALDEVSSDAMGAVIEGVNPWAIICAEDHVPDTVDDSEARRQEISMRRRELVSLSAWFNVHILIVSVATGRGEAYPRCKRQISQQRAHSEVGNRFGPRNGLLESSMYCVGQDQISLLGWVWSTQSGQSYRLAVHLAARTDVIAPRLGLRAMINSTLDLLIDRYSGSWHLTQLGDWHYVWGLTAGTGGRSRIEVQFGEG
jgi:dTDP-4-dehydrorhamnose reductase